MSKLQNDFTTKQPSEKLLALGMPRLSANFYYDDENEVQIVRDPEFELQRKGYFPCWSVGRLIEIHRICSTLPEEQYMFPFWYDIQENVDWAIRVLESGIRTGNIYFSNLEEYL